MARTFKLTKSGVEKKLRGAFVLLFIIFFIAIGLEYWGYLTETREERKLTQFENINFTLSTLLSSINEAVLAYTRSISLSKDTIYSPRIKDLSIVEAKYNSLIESEILEPKEKALIVESKRNWESLSGLLKEYFETGKTTIPAGEIISRSELVSGPLFLLHDSLHKRFRVMRHVANDIRKKINTVFLILIVLGLAGAGGVVLSLYQTIMAFLRERETLFDAVKASTTKSNLEDALHTVLKNAIQLSNAQKGAIFLVDRNNLQVTVSIASGLSDKYLEGVKAFGMKLPGTKAVLENIVVSVPDLLENEVIKGIPEFYNLLKKEGLRAYIVVPLTTEEGPIGALTLYRTIPKPFNDREIQIAQTYAYFVGNILERLYREQIIDSIRKRYQDLFTNVPIGLYRSTPDGKLLDVNPALLKILGYPDLETLRATPIEKIYVEPGQRKVWIEALQKEGVLENFEYQVYRYDGTKIWVSDSARVIYALNGEPLYFEGSIEDITARKIAELSATMRFKRLETLYRLTSSLVEGLPLSEIYELALEGIKEILNADKSGILLLDSNGVMRWKAWSGLSDEYRRATEGHNPWEGTTDRYSPLLISDVSVSDEVSEFRDLMGKEGIRAVAFFPMVYHGKLLGKFMVYYRDVHEFNDEEVQAGISFAEHLAIAIARAYAEQRLNILQLGLHNTADAVFVTDSEGRIIYVNPAYEEITGYTFREVEGKNPRILSSGLYSPEFYREMYKKLNAGEPFRHVFVDKKKDGTLFYFDQTITAILDNRGRIMNFISIGRDITEEVEREKQEAGKHERLKRQHTAIMKMITHRSIAEGNTEVALKFIAEKTAETLNVSIVTIWRYNRTSEKLLNVTKYSSQLNTSLIPDEIDALKYPQYIQAVTSGVNLVTSDIMKDDRFRDFYSGYPQELRITSVIDVPIRVKGKVAGLVCIGSKDKRVWTDDEVSFATHVADVVSQVFLNQEILMYAKELESLKENLETLIEQRTRDIQTLYEISQDISVALNIEDLIEIASEGLFTLINYDLAAFLFHRPPDSNLYFYLARPMTQGIKEEITSLLSNLYYQHRETWLDFKEVTVHEHQIPDYPISNTAIKTLATIFHMPVFAGTDLVGFIVIGKESEIQISPEQARTLYTFAWQLSQALERVLQIREVGLQQTSKVLEFMPQGVVLLDHSLHIQLSNPAGRDIIKKIGHVDETGRLVQIAERNIHDFVSPERRVLTQEVSVTIGGEEKYYNITTKPVILSSDEQACLLILSDITKEKEIQRRLSQQGRLASVGQLAAGIAHDFNNILQGIMGYAEVIKLNDNIPEEVRNQANVILEQGRRAATLVRQILDFSRKTIVKMQPLDLHSFLNDVVSLLKRTLPETIKVTLDIEPENGYIIQGSAPQLQQVFTNLATNARDAMPEGGELMFRLSRLKVEKEEDKPIPELTPGDWVVISVTDTGHGIPPEILPRIFEPFFTTKSGGVGAGLGLAQAYGIVRQHNGFIDVKSVVGRGTTFYIYLPIMTEPMREPHQRPEVSKITEVPMKGAGILFLDDDPTVLNVGKRMLEDLGYKVFPFLDPEEAIEKFDEIKDRVELVVTDLTMPGMSGLDLFYKLREIKPDVRVVLISGYALENPDNLISQGIAGFLPKPFTLNDIKSMLVSVFGAE